MKSVAATVFSNLLRPHVENKRVLEFGCGPGYIVNEVAQVATQVIGVDVSRGAIACAQSLNARKNIRYQVIDGKCLRSLRAASFDVVYSVAVLMHISDELITGILKEMLRVLVPGGEVVLHVPLANIPSDNFDSFDTVRRQICLRYIVRSESAFRRTMEDAGFTAIDIRPVSQLSPGYIDADIRNHHLVTARSR
jgi:SAM-dependent methyltransferase